MTTPLALLVLSTLAAQDQPAGPDPVALHAGRPRQAPESRVPA